MSARRFLTLGLDGGAAALFAAVAGRAIQEVEIEAVADAVELARGAAAEPWATLVVAGGSEETVSLVRSLRRRAVLNGVIWLAPAELLAEPATSLRGLLPLDLLPAEGYTPFDLRRAVLQLEAAVGERARIVELENRLAETEELRQKDGLRAQEASRHLALVEVDEALDGLRSESDLLRAIDEAIGMARRFGTPLACLRLAVDGLSAMRDRHGEGFFGFVLVQVAHRLKRAVRGTDLLARRGQDELHLLCPFTSPAEALTVARRLQAAIAEQPLEQERRTLHVTLSIGIASFTPDLATAAELVARASEALAAATARGPGQVEAR